MFASLIGGLIAGWNLYRSIERSDRQYALGREAERLMSLVKDLETGHRGYVIVGTTGYLEPYREAQALIGPQIETVRSIGIPNGVTEAQIKKISDIIERKLAFANEGVELRERGAVVEATEQIKTNVGKDLMDVLRRDINAIEERTSEVIAGEIAPAIDVASKALAAGLLGLAIAAGYFMIAGRMGRRRMERASELVSEIIDNAPVGLSLIDQHGITRASNVAFAQILGKEDGAIDDLPLATAAPQLNEKIRGKIAVYNALQRQREQPSSSTIQLDENGRQLDLEVRLFPVSLEDDDGHPADGVGIVLQDITRQKQWERDLEKARDAADSANRAKSSFIANMSHELRTPLTAVLGYCELLEEDLTDLGQDQLVNDLNKISINAKHLLGLINDVLDLSKIEAEKMDVHAVPFKTQTMLTELETAVGSLISKKNNTLEIKLGNVAADMNTDDLKLKQVLLNLIGNAAKFTENGKITLQLEPAEVGGSPATRFSVIDTGIGMNDDQLANLFQRFKQADETTTRKFGGTGLGLALTRALTNMLGGEITVTSEEGKGSTFSVEIPNVFIAPVVADTTLPDAPRTLAPGERRAPATQIEPGAIVLIVDDDPSQRDLISRHLAKEGFAVAAAENGLEGLAKARELRPAAILLDIMMPGMNGWHVMKELRDDPATANIPIIIQTVLDEESFAFSLGATDYLKKPVDRTRLGEILKDLRHNQPDDYVMIVDDDEEVRGNLAEMFKRDSWEVIECADGEQALAQLEARLPVLVVADLLMPVMDGYQFVAEVRKNPKWADLPIVVLTSEDLSKQSVRELMAKTTQVVQKGSVPLGELVASLRGLTAKPEQPGGETSVQSGEKVGD